jgi:hypothetical protein
MGGKPRAFRKYDLMSRIRWSMTSWVELDEGYGKGIIKRSQDEFFIEERNIWVRGTS